MSVWGVCMLKDEDDVIERTLRHLWAEGLSGVIALENGSTDETPRILRELRDDVFPRGWLNVIDDPEVGYWQSAKMTAAAKMARDQHGATWVLPFDADEIWVAGDRPLAEAIMLHGDSVNGQAALLFDHYATALDEGDWAADTDDPFTRMGWRKVEPLPLPKVVVRVSALRSIEAGNHGAKLTEDSWSSGVLTVHHFPYRSPGQMLSKVRNGSAAYKATDLPSTTGLHWRQMGEALDQHGEAAILSWWQSFYYSHPAESGLIYDPAPVSA